MESEQAELTSIVVPPGEGRAVLVSAGQTLTVVDVRGGQVGDLFAFAAEDPREHLSASHTRTQTERLFPGVGQAFVSNRRRPLLELLADDSPGVHDMLISACDPERYAALGVTGWHASCAENLRRALAAHGVVPSCVPQPVNLFMNIAIDGGRLIWAPAPTAPGSSVTFRALADLHVVLSACPQDIVGINEDGLTELEIHLSRS